MPLSKESIAEAKRKLEALDKKDAERRRTAELKNNLEGYIYTTKEKVWSFWWIHLAFIKGKWVVSYYVLILCIIPSHI